MEQKYYIIYQGQPAGPMDAARLQSYGLTPDSAIWHEGLPDWVKASTVPELAPYLYHTNPGTVNVPPVQPFGSPQTASAYPSYGQKPVYGPAVPHKNWLTPAIIATVLGFLFSCIGVVFGIIAITQASAANNAYARGDEYEGERRNSSAKTWTIVTYVLCGIGLLISILCLAFAGNAGFDIYMNR